MSLYYPLSTPLFLCFILSSACFVYFSYGTHLLTQTLMIVTGSVITCVCVCLSIFISPMIVMSFVFLILISCLCYFYSSLNIGCLFIAKLNLVFISFAITGAFSDYACPILHAGVAILIATTKALQDHKNTELLCIRFLNLKLVPGLSRRIHSWAPFDITEVHFAKAISLLKKQLQTFPPGEVRLVPVRVDPADQGGAAKSKACAATHRFFAASTQQLQAPDDERENTTYPLPH